MVCASLIFIFSLVGCLYGLNNESTNKNVGNIIHDDEKRGTTPEIKSETKKRALFSFSSIGGSKHHSSYPSGYDSSGPGYEGGYGGSGHSYNSGNGYSSGHSYNSGHGYGFTPPSGHEYDGYGQSGPEYHGGYGHGGHGQVQHGGGDHSGLYLKKLLIPLAGIALLGAAAALSTNPVLLQLGVVNGKRKRRSVEKNLLQNVYPANPNVKPN